MRLAAQLLELDAVRKERDFWQSNYEELSEVAADTAEALSKERDQWREIAETVESDLWELKHKTPTSALNYKERKTLVAVKSYIDEVLNGDYR